MTKGVHINIASASDEFVFEDALQTWLDTEQGFMYQNMFDNCKPEAFEKFINDIEDEINTLKVYNYDKTKNQVQRHYIGEHLKILVSGNSLEYFVVILSKSEEMKHKSWTIFQKYTPKHDEIDIYVTSYFMTRGELDSSNKTLKTKDYDYITNKYYPYINTDVMFSQFFTGSENILLAVGLPGLGKSKLASLAIKYAYQNTDKLPYDKIKDNVVLDNQYINVAFIKSSEVLSSDKFWRNLEVQKVDFVVIDDLDYMLTKRDSEVQTADDVIKNRFLNQFLSYTDGVEKFNTKFIITTNQKYDDIDSALLRKGRLFDILELRKLKTSEALKIWEDSKLTKEEFHEVFNSDDIISADLGSEIDKRLNTRIDNSTESYIKEDGISRIIKAGRSKKIGL